MRRRIKRVNLEGIGIRQIKKLRPGILSKGFPNMGHFGSGGKKNEKIARAKRKTRTPDITYKMRKLAMVFTKRDQSIRIISARDMNKKERGYYAAQES